MGVTVDDPLVGERRVQSACSRILIVDESCSEDGVAVWGLTPSLRGLGSETRPISTYSNLTA